MAKRQCSTSVSPSQVPKWVWVLPTSTTRSSTAASPRPAVGSRTWPPSSTSCTAPTPAQAVRRRWSSRACRSRSSSCRRRCHVPLQRLRFGQRTVPGDQVRGRREGLRARRAILAPPRRAGARAARCTRRRRASTEAERWGDEVLQPMARRLLWRGLQRDHERDARLPGGRQAPDAAQARSCARWRRLITRIERADERATGDGIVRADLRALPGPPRPGRRAGSPTA